jgi:transcriptional regulator with XRE-family HTH domain
VIKVNHITGRQIAAARALANISQADLASAARISVPTLARMEASEGPAPGFFNNVQAVKTALEKTGVDFTNGDALGVRLRKGPMGDPSASIPVEKLTSQNDE